MTESCFDSTHTTQGKNIFHPYFDEILSISKPDLLSSYQTFIPELRGKMHT